MQSIVLLNLEKKMRKAQKQQIEKLVKQMEEAHDQIKRYIGQGMLQASMELLRDCQNGGIAIGTLIEETEGEGHPAVLLLEEYCELVYCIHEKLAEGMEYDVEESEKEINENKAYKFLRQKLIKIKNCIKNDVPVKIQAVFLPYKASMWDSLESVWMAAEADENCDAYVIPIPYYDRKSDGSFGEMHYEGKQYPSYVPITDYNEFDFEQHQPDMIFIHNPYDGFNRVTSIHPRFYSEELKKFTEKLIYVPYFILGEIKPDQEARIESIKHFCTVPGVFNADKVIVESEDMRQVYLKVLMEATGDHSKMARKYWEEKILGLGSPKFEKTTNTKRKDIKMPEEWLMIIRKPDGSYKKVIFYNTSVTGLLHSDEKMLEKIDYVFGKFKENKEKVALLWRPHPLIKATIESMRPQLWAKYDQIVKNYVKEGWGIYDDTADVDRAIAVSDAYYGDISSVVQMYRKTGKPVMIQDVDINT